VRPSGVRAMNTALTTRAKSTFCRTILPTRRLRPTAAGSDAALETADVALMSADLRRLPQAMSLSRRVLRLIRQNIAVSLLLKVVFMGLTPFGLTTLWMAVLADMGASLLVIFNGLRALGAPNRRAAARTR